MASSNKALKTMDGAAHGLYAYSKAREDVKEWNRIDYSRATTAEKEEKAHVPISVEFGRSWATAFAPPRQSSNDDSTTHTPSATFS